MYKNSDIEWLKYANKMNDSRSTAWKKKNRKSLVVIAGCWCKTMTPKT